MSTVAVQLKDGGPWTHGVTEEANSSDHIGIYYLINQRDENEQTNNREHEIHMKHPRSNKAIPLGT